MAPEISGDERALAIKFINMDFLCASLYWECGDNQVCVAPVETEEGDVAAILAGGDYMYILRPVPGKDSYLYVGEAWIHDFMEGEACHELDWQQRFTILKIE
ncbi:hypothetical protein BGZ57DRAFT_855578 [Hyaloscypha finlandica]|nr:hypothetical protein BGZ57DRAFT_855578 [Hyaloscypha finlandica]KAH8806495.1 hypothetical protein F5882DRAFT_373422 [Hyaloscypha sp. PMI_1271]